MKNCPSCRTEYADDTLKFCLQDGTRLSDGFDDSPTESETVVSPKMRFDIQDSSAQSFPPSQTTRISSIQPKPKSSNTFLIVLLTAFGMLLLFGGIGIGAWFYLKNNQTEVAKNTTNSTNTANQTFENDLPKNSNTKKTATPKPPTNSSVSNVITNTETPPEIDREQVKSDVSDSLDNWKSQAEAGDLNAFMDSYADKIDYYRKSGASSSFVRNDKQRAFTKFDSIRVDLSNISVTPDASGERATAVFDKEWQFSGAGSSSSGKVRQQMSLRKIGGRWLITGEKDLKVYYTQ